MPPRPPASTSTSTQSFSYDESTLRSSDPLQQDSSKNQTQSQQLYDPESQIGSNISYGGRGSFIPPSSPQQSSPNQDPLTYPLPRTSTSSVPAYELDSHRYPPAGSRSTPSSNYHRVGQEEQEHQHHPAFDRNGNQSESQKWSKLMNDAGVKDGKRRQVDDHNLPLDNDGFWDRVERNSGVSKVVGETGTA